MPALSNPLREKYAHARASGKKPSEAYEFAGFKGKGKAQSANRLEREANVSARIQELIELAESIPVAASWLNKNFVLEGLRKTFTRAMELDKLSDALKALELMGRELGMFVTRTENRFTWNGDPAQLDDAQLEALTAAMERLAYGENEVRVREERRRVLSEAGQTVLDVVKEEPTTEPPLNENTPTV